MSWEFVSGIVSTESSPINTFVRRIYYAIYKQGDIRRMFVASFVYTKVETFDKEAFVEALMAGREPAIEPLNSNLKIVDRGCTLGSITEYNVLEESQLPQDPTTIEHLYEQLTNNENDSDEAYTTLKHFEKYLKVCDVTECVCTLTDDRESTRRVNEILGLQTSGGEEKEIVAGASL